MGSKAAGVYGLDTVGILGDKCEEVMRCGGRCPLRGRAPCEPVCLFAMGLVSLNDARVVLERHEIDAVGDDCTI